MGNESRTTSHEPRATNTDESRVTCDVSRQLAQFIVSSRWGDVPRTIRHEAKRAVLNWLACALGGCRDDAVGRAFAALAEFSGPRRATLIGRRERVDPLLAACINGLSSNILDYDDTHLQTVVHPSVPVAAAVFAAAEHHPVTGAQLLHAFVLGVETECRIAAAIPEHYAAGWHITATCGVFGAAAASGRLLGLDTQQMTWALGIAATQSSGLTEMLGSMCKSYNIAYAARSGLLAALLAAENFTSSERGIEAPRGFAHVLATNARLDVITKNLGETWALSGTAYKPYPCGIVLHSVIDGCIQLREQHGLKAGSIERVDVRSHPLALELAGKSAPHDGLEGKLSAYHAAAVALLFGKAGVAQFTDECVQDPQVVALRQKVVVHPDVSLEKMEARVSVLLDDGRELHQHVQHALGSLERPLTDRDIETKFHELAAASRSECHAWDVIELAWSLDMLRDAAELVRATAPEMP